MLKYTFSLILLGIMFSVNAQKQQWKGLMLGVDLSRLAVPFVDSTRYGWEISGQYEILEDMYGVVEIGSQATKFATPNYSYNSAGGYTKIGVDYNYMKHMEEKSNDQMLIGLRYGFTTFYHEANNIRVRDNGWGEYTGGAIPRNWLSSNWLEIVAGMRAKLFNNFYLGWTARIKINLFTTKDNDLKPYHIPGFGRGYESSAIGINYSLYYMIPLKKKGTKVK